MEEKILTFNIRKKVLRIPKWRRGIETTKILREKIKKVAKSEKVLIDKKLNEKIWSRGIEKPLTKIRIKLVKLDEKTTRAELVELK